MRFDCHNPVLVPGVGIGHKYFSGEKFRDPVSSACADSDLRCPDHGTSTAQSDLCVVVPGVGIEPTFLSEHDLKSCAYTNSATRAFYRIYIRKPYVPTMRALNQMQSAE